tara:strand:+ start:2022 stop:2768 length:747 start_codon:yes stop_codon:yes gene_type:complete
MLTGRNRRKTHAGIPHGSTCNLGTRLQIYYQYNSGESAELWSDQSVNNNDAVQEVADNQPVAVTGGGLDFEDTDEASTASSMQFTNFSIPVDTDFLAFIACNLETSALNGLNCYLSDSGGEVLEFVSHTKHQLKTGEANTNLIHNAVFTINPAEKTVFVLHRTNGATGTLKMYKSGLLCNGNNNTGSTNAGNLDLQNLGVKNNPSSESHWFDGIMYDVGVITGNAASDINREIITDYLLGKHGMERLG